MKEYITFSVDQINYISTQDWILEGSNQSKLTFFIFITVLNVFTNFPHFFNKIIMIFAVYFLLPLFWSLVIFEILELVEIIPFISYNFVKFLLMIGVLRESGRVVESYTRRLLKLFVSLFSCRIVVNIVVEIIPDRINLLVERLYTHFLNRLVHFVFILLHRRLRLIITGKFFIFFLSWLFSES